MSRVRVSTTVDEDLLRSARELFVGSTDARLLDEALRALVASYRRAEIDASYRAYDDVPLDTTDEWGDLASFRDAAGRS
ncbi:MAG: type II toxin-antitoxin system VapB family antitoxin [Actinomycetota bacterium]|nr:type II toxin-antitoxin system VapB family antitoxin [Actinomycetota bacterium]